MKKLCLVAAVLLAASTPASALFGLFSKDPCAIDLGFAEIWVCGPRK